MAGTRGYVLFCGLIAGIAGIGSLPGLAGEGVDRGPKQGAKQASKIVGADDDAEPGVNPDLDSFRRARLDKSDPVYKEIKDEAPMAASEAGAFEQVFQHARNCPLKDLTMRARWKVEYVDLAGVGRVNFLRDLIKIKGRLIQIRKVADAGKWLHQTPDADLYEGWIYADDDRSKPVCVNFSELPPEFKIGDNLEDRVVFDGYFFKLLSYKSSHADDEGKPVWNSAPLLIGRTISMDEQHLHTADAAADEAARVRLNKDDYNSVIDKKPMASLGENYYEYTAYGLTFLHAHRFSPEVLARHSRKNVVYADLLGDLRDRYLRELLHVEGRLVRLRKLAPNERLRDTSDIKEIYEGWIYHENEFQHPMVVVFTELPPEISPGELLSYRVSLDGYYFKLMAYPSKEKDANGKPVWRVAPLLIGRKLQSMETESSVWDNFVPLVLVGIGFVFVSIVGLTIWFRRGDRRIRREMRGSMVKENPFTEAPPVVEPGAAWNRLNDPPSLN